MGRIYRRMLRYRRRVSAPAVAGRGEVWGFMGRSYFQRDMANGGLDGQLSFYFILLDVGPPTCCEFPTLLPLSASLRGRITRWGHHFHFP